MTAAAALEIRPDDLSGAILTRIVAEARARGLVRLGLETGTGPASEPALALCRSRGFADGDSFAGYPDTPFNRFLHLPL